MLHDWDKLRIFHLTAKAGSLTKAGTLLGLSQSAVSRQIAELETQMGMTLFNRHARGLVLTEQGEILAATAREMFIRLKTTEMHLLENKEHPSGMLRVNTTNSLGALWLTPMLPEFYALYPDIQITLMLSDNNNDIAQREGDIAIGVLLPRRSDIIRKPLMSVELRAYAHQSYIDKRGSANSLADLAKHDLIAFPYEVPAPSTHLNWLLETGMRPNEVRSARLMVNSFHAVRASILAGLGIGSLPDYLVGPNSGELVQQLKGVPAPKTDIFMTYPSSFRNSGRVATFRDFLLRKIAESSINK